MKGQHNPPDSVSRTCLEPMLAWLVFRLFVTAINAIKLFRVDWTNRIRLPRASTHIISPVRANNFRSRLAIEWFASFPS